MPSPCPVTAPEDKRPFPAITGDVDSQQVRDQTQQLVAAVPNVVQVVNEIQVKNQKATGTN